MNYSRSAARVERNLSIHTSEYQQLDLFSFLVRRIFLVAHSGTGAQGADGFRMSSEESRRNLWWTFWKIICLDGRGEEGNLAGGGVLGFHGICALGGAFLSLSRTE